VQVQHGEWFARPKNDFGSVSQHFFSQGVKFGAMDEDGKRLNGEPRQIREWEAGGLRDYWMGGGTPNSAEDLSRFIRVYPAIENSERRPQLCGWPDLAVGHQENYYEPDSRHQTTRGRESAKRRVSGDVGGTSFLAGRQKGHTAPCAPGAWPDRPGGEVRANQGKSR